MSLRAGVFRIIRITAISLLALLLIALVLLQFHQHLIRHRSERLLADFQSIRLNQTTWPEAQALVQHWGKFGHAHGTCNSTDCAYDITVIGWPSLLSNGNGMATRWLYRLGCFPLLLQRVGMRFSVLELRLLVEDGIVRRTRLSLSAETRGARGSLALLLVTVSGRATLNRSDDSPNTVGIDEELGMHPSFVVGPDGFCTGCETISLAYTPQITSDELLRLTSFDLSCLTWRSCAHLLNLAPALMTEDAKNLRDVPRNSVSCSTPVWALARDAGDIWLVDTVATAQVPDPNPPYGETPSHIEQDQIRLVRILKGPPLILPQKTIRFRPYSGVEYQARAVPEHLIQGRRYIVLPLTDSDWPKEGAEAWRCGVLEDTPVNELSIKQGTAMDDHLRAPELTGAWPW